MGIFLNTDHQLRSGWRFLIYVVFFLVLWFAGALLLSQLFVMSNMDLTPLVELSLNAAALTIPAIGCLFLISRLIDRVPAAVFGATLHEGWTRDIGYGLALGLALNAFVAAGLYFTGGLQLAAAAFDGPRFAWTLLVVAVSAANEELVFRGYPMQVLMRGIGPWPAAVALSLVFGALHASNPNASLPGLLNTVLAGLFLAYAYFRTRSLWLPFGFHFGWNAGLGMLFGFPLSGLRTASLLFADATGPAWWTGAAYGPEGGLIVSLGLLLGVFAMIRFQAIRVSPKMLRLLTSHHQQVYLRTDQFKEGVS